ncbi:hypothetical protein ACT691_00310, partial [Vibrio metschnikovii]
QIPSDEAQHISILKYLSIRNHGVPMSTISGALGQNMFEISVTCAQGFRSYTRYAFGLKIKGSMAAGFEAIILRPI